MFERIAEAIAARVADGSLGVGTRLPAARDLADTLGVNVHTVLHAYQRLRDDGLVELRRGRGAVVLAPPVPERIRALASSLVQTAREEGVAPAVLITLIRTEYSQ